ncbi:MAG: hypothetical protein ACOCQD_01625 [archaeon]
MKFKVLFDPRFGDPEVDIEEYEVHARNTLGDKLENLPIEVMITEWVPLSGGNETQWQLHELRQGEPEDEDVLADITNLQHHDKMNIMGWSADYRIVPVVHDGDKVMVASTVVRALGLQKLSTIFLNEDDDNPYEWYEL